MPPVRKQPPPAKMPPLSVQAVPDPTAQRVLGDWVGGIATYYGEQYQYVEVRHRPLSCSIRRCKHGDPKMQNCQVSLQYPL